MIKAAVKKIVSLFGLEIRKSDTARKKIGDYTYEAIRPWARYAPWWDDDDFLDLYRQIKAHTLVDIYRCWELWDLMSQASHLPGDVLEVGVWRGGTGSLLCKRAPDKRVYLADTFSGVVKTGAKDPHYFGGEHSDTSINVVERLIASLKIRNATIWKGIFPDDFDDLPSYCFVHIDVDVYESAKGVFDAVWPRISVGGVVVFDDYGFDTTSGVAELVNSYKNDPEKLIIHNLNGHAIAIKLSESNLKP